MAKVEQLQPSLIHACKCGAELRDNIRTLDLVCKVCSTTIPKQERLDIELASHTFLHIAEDLGIEGVEIGNVLYEIDEAAMPTGLLPYIIDRAAQTSLHISPEKEFYFRVSEYASSDVSISATHLYVEVNPTSKMTIKEALPILSHTTRRLVEMSRLQDPQNTLINDLRIMSMTELAEGFTEEPVAAAS